MANDFPKQLDRKIIYESDWIHLYTDKVKMPNGDIIDTYHQLHYPHGSVCIVVCNEHDEILLIQSKRYTTHRMEWEVPAGRIEIGENPEDAVKRECLEETGCDIKEIKYLCCNNPSNDMADLVVHIFGAKVEKQIDVFDKNEVSEKHWIKKEKIVEMINKNEIHCGISMLALLYAIQFYL